MRPVPNLQQPLVRFVQQAGKTIGLVTDIFSLWFQQFSQAPAAVQNVIVGSSPFDYTPNDVGTLYITGGTVSDVSFIRGSTIISLGSVKSVLVSIGDTVRVTYSVLPTIQFATLFGVNTQG